MEKQAVIFDFNGTMFFDTIFQLNAWNQVLADHQMDPIPEEEYRNVLCGRGSMETVRYIWGDRLTEEESTRYRMKKKDYYQQLCLSDPEHFCLVPGLEAYLDALCENEIPFTIATSASPYSVDFYFENLHLDRWFRRENVVCNDRFKKGKPAPDLFLVAAEVLGVKPEDCLVFEDANAGIRAANAAGIGSVIVIDPECRFCPELDLKFDAVYPNFRAVFVENTVKCKEKT
ncbi:MAG: HAD family phosphatase [Eubacteriales bacterium]|nr:HAD family phosphatase [Eubacteriales bacterium]